MAAESQLEKTFFEMAKLNPGQMFDKPGDVLKASLSDAEKLQVLGSWENEAHQLQAASAENMTGGESSKLDEVRKAIDTLAKAAE